MEYTIDIIVPHGTGMPAHTKETVRLSATVFSVNTQVPCKLDAELLRSWSVMGWLRFAKAGNLFDCKNGQAMPTVTIQEYLKNVEELELEADLVLGDNEGKDCIYNNGYVKKQAIFSCLTCTPDGNYGVFKMILGEGEFQEILFKHSRQPA